MWIGQACTLTLSPGMMMMMIIIIIIIVIIIIMQI